MTFIVKPKFPSQPMFEEIFNLIYDTPHAGAMRNTVEDSPWHREKNTWVHSEMCLNYYFTYIAKDRTPKQQMITALALLFHDFGKPDAEETKERKDGSGEYRSYAGHEKVSANEFICVFKDYNLMELLNKGELDITDVRSIKWMIEQHLPYGLEKAEKRKALRTSLNATLGADEVCFYDMLLSDANGRISDDHPEKLKKVNEWITSFDAIIAQPRIMPSNAPIMYLLVGPSGAGKTTWRNAFVKTHPEAIVACEDDWRVEYAKANMSADDGEMMSKLDAAPAYDMAWNFCHMDKDSKYEQFAKTKYANILKSGADIILDRTNQTRKNRRPWINSAKMQGYTVISIEFYMSVNESNARQVTRVDKFIKDSFVRKIVMNMETPWLGDEVDGFFIVT